MFLSQLGPDQRESAVSQLGTEQFDILVIGGGVTGVGAALDAASRGLKVALIDSQDIASGTSSRSSKLIHGGLRYLEQYDFKLVREALHERELMVATCAPIL
jgi:glycerol-3-phosphate dehydrogenase